MVSQKWLRASNILSTVGSGISTGQGWQGRGESEWSDGKTAFDFVDQTKHQLLCDPKRWQFGHSVGQQVVDRNEWCSSARRSRHNAGPASHELISARDYGLFGAIDVRSDKYFEPILVGKHFQVIPIYQMFWSQRLVHTYCYCFYLFRDLSVKRLPHLSPLWLPIGLQLVYVLCRESLWTM